MYYLFKNKHLYSTIAVLTGLFSACAAADEYLPSGDFELGIVDLEIQRDPRHTLPDQSFIPAAPRLESATPLAGRYSLAIPGSPDGISHRLTFKTLPLVAGKPYDFSMLAQSQARARITVQAVCGWHSAAGAEVTGSAPAATPSR